MKLCSVQDHPGRNHQDGETEIVRGADGREAAAALIDAFINLGRDVVDADLVAQDGGHAEMRQRIERHQQRAGGDAGQHERQGDLAGDGEQPAPEMRADSSSVGIHALERPGDLDEDKGEQIHGFDGDDSGQSCKC